MSRGEAKGRLKNPGAKPAQFIHPLAVCEKDRRKNHEGRKGKSAKHKRRRNRRAARLEENQFREAPAQGIDVLEVGYPKRTCLANEGQEGSNGQKRLTSQREKMPDAEKATA